MFEYLKLMYATGQEALSLRVSIEETRKSRGSGGLAMRLELASRNPQLLKEIDGKLDQEIKKYQQQLDALPKPKGLPQKIAYELGYIVANHF